MKKDMVERFEVGDEVRLKFNDPLDLEFVNVYLVERTDDHAGEQTVYLIADAPDGSCKLMRDCISSKLLVLSDA